MNRDKKQKALRIGAAGGAIAIAIAIAGVACGTKDFDPASKVSSVRILAVKASAPFAKPGDDVDLEVLAVDGRNAPATPMNVYWIPIACVNPPGDAYYGCFRLGGADAGASDAGDAEVDGGAEAGGADAGTAPPSGGFGLLRPGVDLTPVLVAGPRFSIRVPTDAISSHVATPGTKEPYGVVIVFNVACAGHVEVIAQDPANGVQGPPIGCFDAHHVQLGPSDYAIGFFRVYAYASRTNQNPTIDGVLFDGGAVDTTQGITVDRCGATKCPTFPIDVVVPASSQETDPDDLDVNGAPRREQIWAAYFATTGSVESDDRLLYEPKTGKNDDSANKYDPPALTDPAGLGHAWIVVHDSRGGADWVDVPIHAR